MTIKSKLENKAAGYKIVRQRAKDADWAHLLSECGIDEYSSDIDSIIITIGLRTVMNRIKTIKKET